MCMRETLLIIVLVCLLPLILLGFCLRFFDLIFLSFSFSFSSSSFARARQITKCIWPWLSPKGRCQTCTMPSNVTALRSLSHYPLSSFKNSFFGPSTLPSVRGRLVECMYSVVLVLKARGLFVNNVTVRHPIMYTALLFSDFTLFFHDFSIYTYIYWFSLTLSSHFKHLSPPANAWNGWHYSPGTPTRMDTSYLCSWVGKRGLGGNCRPACENIKRPRFIFFAKYFLVLFLNLSA